MLTKKSTDNQIELLDDSAVAASVSRRKFLGYAGVSSLLLGTLASSCKKNDTTTANGVVDLGTGDVGILNYAYALEQLEAAFYLQVVASTNTGLSVMEMDYMNDIRNHEVAHREFFKAALGSAAIPSLQVDFSTINFSSRTSILGTAQAFEDLGVTAYNGAGQLLQSSAYLLLAGKIVSVEARHAALIRDLISNGTFADSVDANALDGARKPSEVLAIAGTYIKTKIDASHLPS